MSPAEIVQMALLAVCVGGGLFMTVVAFKAWKGDKYLCDDCKYNDPEKCQKPERPTATDCAAYAKKD